MSRNVTYGIHAVRFLLSRHPQRVRRLLLAATRDDRRLGELRALAEHAGIAISTADEAQLGELAAGGRHQGAVAETVATAGDPETELETAIEAGGVAPLLLALDGVQDPHNLGACLRSADAAGVKAVIAPRDRSASLTAVARKVAAGAAEAVPFIAVVNLARVLRSLSERGFRVIGAEGSAQTNLYQADLGGPLVVVLGSEGGGLRRLTRECCDELVAIPMAGAVESLNVSVATGVMLFEAVRQRKWGHSPFRSPPAGVLSPK
ncbi:MAG TPA: 23S rRNA (guanosine(2251)-2'-O)-methyltransferase RlmB [Burkholderiales bacterium]|nr:23S rRNA (guanosine(2251)-2'-O)-methyltransferase RlmB [Burkholderiales bacterium]